MSLGNINSRSNFTAAITSSPPPTELSPVDAEVVEKDETVRYAELTKIRIDRALRKKILEFSETILKSDKKFISVREARIINLKARAINPDVKTDLIPLSLKIVARVPIDKFIRNRLNQLTNLQKIALDLGFASSNLSEYAQVRSKTILKEKADKYNEYFAEHNLGNGAKTFDLERLFRLALTEPISEKTEKICKKILIKMEDKHREELIKLPSEVTSTQFFQQRVRGFIKRKETKTIPLKDVVDIHKIAGKEIFKLSNEVVVSLPVLPEHVEKLIALEKDKEVDEKIREKISKLISGSVQTITREMAEEINSALGETVFDIDSLLAEGRQEAEKEKEAEKEAAWLVPSKKRSSSETSSTSEELSDEPSSKKQRISDDSTNIAKLQLPSFAELDLALSFEPSSKKQRISDDSTNTAKPQLPSFAELDLALSLRRMAEHHAQEFHLKPPLPSSRVDCYFQYPPFIRQL